MGTNVPKQPNIPPMPNKRKMSMAEQIKQTIMQMEKYGQKPYVFICNPAEQISKKDLPENISLVRNLLCELGKGYLMESDPYDRI